jgi:hypothetical protein
MTTTEDFIKKLRHLTLTKTEAQDMREKLLSYTNFYPATEAAKVSSVQWRSVQTFMLSYVRSYPRTLISAALIVVILVGTTGVTYASEGTLPGQVLYPVKVSVIEPIQGALITTPVGKAEWQTELADRRLTEASTLAARNDLATSTQEYLAAQASEHVALAQTDAATLANSGDTSAALNVQADLDARLSAHSEFLAVVTSRLEAAGDATSTVDAVVALLHSVQTERNHIMTSQVATEIALGDPSASASVTSTSTEPTATSTPAEKRAIAYVDAENFEQHVEENTLFEQNATLLSLLPPPLGLSSTTASTTAGFIASTTISIPDDGSASSTDATSTLLRLRLYKWRMEHAASTTPSIPPVSQ